MGAKWATFLGLIFAPLQDQWWNLKPETINNVNVKFWDQDYKTNKAPTSIGSWVFLQSIFRHFFLKKQFSSGGNFFVGRGPLDFFLFGHPCLDISPSLSVDVIKSQRFKDQKSSRGSHRFSQFYLYEKGSRKELTPSLNQSRINIKKTKTNKSFSMTWLIEWLRERGLLHSDEVWTIKWRNKISLAQFKMIKGQKYKLNKTSL